MAVHVVSLTVRMALYPLFLAFICTKMFLNLKHAQSNYGTVWVLRLLLLWTFVN